MSTYRLVRMSTYRLVRMAFLSIILYVSQVALAFLPNIEVVSLLIVVFTLIYKKDIKYVCALYVLFTGIQWGFGLWWWSYLVIWPLFSVVVNLLSGLVKENWFIWTIILGIWGIIFGALFAIPYIFIDPSFAFSYWIAGIPWDMLHCAGNVIIAATIGKPIYKALVRIENNNGINRDHGMQNYLKPWN